MRMYTGVVKRDVEGVWRWTPVVGAMLGVGVCDLVRGEALWCGAAAELRHRSPRLTPLSLLL